MTDIAKNRFIVLLVDNDSEVAVDPDCPKVLVLGSIYAMQRKTRSGRVRHIVKYDRLGCQLFSIGQPIETAMKCVRELQHDDSTIPYPVREGLGLEWYTRSQEILLALPKVRLKIRTRCRRAIEGCGRWQRARRRTHLSLLHLLELRDQPLTYLRFGDNGYLADHRFLDGEAQLFRRGVSEAHLPLGSFKSVSVD
jgi:hypothetical protein